VLFGTFGFLKYFPIGTFIKFVLIFFSNQQFFAQRTFFQKNIPKQRSSLKQDSKLEKPLKKFKNDIKDILKSFPECNEKGG